MILLLIKSVDLDLPPSAKTDRGSSRFLIRAVTAFPHQNLKKKRARLITKV